MNWELFESESVRIRKPMVTLKSWSAHFCSCDSLSILQYSTLGCILSETNLENYTRMHAILVWCLSESNIPSASILNYLLATIKKSCLNLLITDSQRPFYLLESRQMIPEKIIDTWRPMNVIRPMS